jgi:hypothetical protein
MYITMVQALHPDLHIGAVRRVHSTLISEFSVETHKLEVATKPRDKTTEIYKIPTGLKCKKHIIPEGEELL